VVDFVEVAHGGVDLEMDQLVVASASPIAGKTLRDLGLPARTGATVVAVRKADGATAYNPRPELLVQAGDTLILVGRKGCADAVQKLQPDTPADGTAYFHSQEGELSPSPTELETKR
jgi:voltage-gated potassium channel